MNYQHIQLHTIDSTNRYLKDYCRQYQPEQPVFCSTEQQTCGYGQRQRSWVTNQDSAIFSLAYRIANDTPINGLLSLNIAAKVHETLHHLTQAQLYLKWPNDLFTDQGKAAGILIEQVLQKHYRALIIGIGINRSQTFEDAGHVPYFELTDFINSFSRHLASQELLQFDPQRLHHYWQIHDYFQMNETVKIVTDKPTSSHPNTGCETTLLGTYQGINLQGQATIQLPHGFTYLSSGLNSIRKLHEGN